MADTTLPGVLLTGDHASRPAANAVATGTVYACSTHDLIYQSDGSSWSTWSDVSGASGGVLTTQGDILYRDGSGLQRLAIGTASEVLTVNAGATAPEWAAAGGGGGTASPFWWHSDNAPGSPDAANREFNEGTTVGTLTRVNHGTPKGTWAETMDGLEWTHTVTLAAGEMDVYAIPRTINVGDYVTIAASYPLYMPNFIGPFVGFSNGTVFGTSNAVGPFLHFTGNSYRSGMNNWPGHNSRVDGTTTWYDTPYPSLPHGYRVKYEAANTWGLYVRWAGGGWRAVQTNYSYTLSPTHIVFGIASNGATYAATNGAQLRIECVRVND